MDNGVWKSVDVNVVRHCVNVEDEILHLLKDVVIYDRDPNARDTAIGTALREGYSVVNFHEVFISW